MMAEVNIVRGILPECFITYVSRRFPEVKEVRDCHEISVSSYGAIRTNCIVPFSVERVGTNIYLCDLLF